MISTGQLPNSPYYEMVPKDFSANIRWRKAILEQGKGDRKAAHDLWCMCKRDLLFYANTFVWTLDPLRHPNQPVRPFITYDYQDRALLEINDAIGHHDVLIKKSRDMGATWLCLVCFEWRWHFMDHQLFLLSSRNESYVDAPNNDKALFQKVDFIHAHLPSWMRPSINRTKLHLDNEDNKSKMEGESSTGDLGRGDRRTAILCDEAAAWDRADGYRALGSTQSATTCRIFNSTPQGIGNAYADMAIGQKRCPNQLTFHWSDHPEKNRGLYTSRANRLEILDKAFIYPVGYQFITDNKLRSPWYDGECRRTPINSLIAQELDIDFLGSGTQFYDAEMIAKTIAEYVRRPLKTGDLAYSGDGTPTGFFEGKKGRMKLWACPDGQNEWPKDREYTVGVDISAGTGASNSVIVCGDKKTGEKIVEFVDPNIRPEDLAVCAVSICNWLNEAFLMWEANGPGRQFGAQVLELGYRHIHFRQDEQKFPKVNSKVPGWYSTAQTKRVLLSEYGIALASGNFINRSREALDECGEIVYLDDGSVGHVQGASVFDPSGAGDNHADRVIADALCWKGMKERPYEASKEIQEVPAGSFIARRERREKAAKADKSVFNF